jgi:hypothetical protein
MRKLIIPAACFLLLIVGANAVNPNFSLQSLTAAAPRFETDSVVVAIPRGRPIRIPPRVDANIPLQIEATAPPQSEADPVPEIEAAQIVEPQSAPPVVYRSFDDMCTALGEAAAANDLPTPFLIRLLFQESAFQADLVSRAGALGVAQFMPLTAESVGLGNPFDPLEAIPASAKLLRTLSQRFGNLGLAAAAYNAGPSRIQAWLASKGKVPHETQAYVATITGRAIENWKLADTGTPVTRLPRHAPCQDMAGLHAWNGPDVIPVPQPSPLRVVAQADIAARADRGALAHDHKPPSTAYASHAVRRQKQTLRQPAVRQQAVGQQLAAVSRNGRK